MDVDSVASHIHESLRIGKLHGADRARKRSYLLREVIFEYHILREVLFEGLETDGPMPNITRDILLDAIDIQQKFFDALSHESDKGTFIL